MQIKSTAKPLPWLKKLKACEDVQTWAAQFNTLGECWEACKNVDWLLWIIDAAGIRDDTKDRIFACRCIRETPLSDGRKVWDLLTDVRSRNAVEVAEQFAAGNAIQVELDADWAAAWAADWIAAWAANKAADRAAAKAAQAKILKEVYGNPFSATKQESTNAS